MGFTTKTILHGGNVMETSLITALAALGGALVGAFASFAGMYLAQRQETKRALRRELFSAATTVWGRKYEHTRERGGALLPLEDFILDFMSLEGLIERYRTLSDEELLEFLSKRDSRFQKIVEYRKKELHFRSSQ